MVAPVVAAGVRAAAGAGARTAGARAAGGRAAGTTRMLRNAKTGRFTGSEWISRSPGEKAGISQGPTKSAKELASIMKKMLKSTEKQRKLAEGASPLLKQQLVIAKKGFLLILRPFGDLIGKLLRPFLILFLKVGLLLYKWLSPLLGGKEDTEDKVKNLEDQAAALERLGLVDEANALREEIGELTKKREYTFLDGLKLAGKWIWENIIKPGFWLLIDAGKWVWNEIIKPGFWALIDASKWLWNEIIKPGFWAIVDWSKRIWDEYIVPGFVAIVDWSKRIWNEYIAPWLDPILSWANRIWDDYIVPGFWGIIDWGKNIWETYISPPFNTLKTKIGTIWDSLKSAFDAVINKIKGWWPFGGKGGGGKGGGGGLPWSQATSSTKSNGDGTQTTTYYNKDGSTKSKKITKSKAVGGTISNTGEYLLHAGERVVTAADMQRTKGGNTLSFSNVFNIAATINTDLDIKSLARRLAELQETELRRRVSY